MEKIYTITVIPFGVNNAPVKAIIKNDRRMAAISYRIRKGMEKDGFYKSCKLKVSFQDTYEKPGHLIHGNVKGYFYGLTRALEKAFAVSKENYESFLNSEEAIEAERIIHKRGLSKNQLNSYLKFYGYSITTGESDSFGDLTWLVYKQGEPRPLVIG